MIGIMMITRVAWAVGGDRCFVFTSGGGSKIGGQGNEVRSRDR